MQIKGIKGYFDPHMTNAKPPPSEEYQAWLDRPTNRVRCRPTYVGSSKEMTGAKLRRVVIMRKQGESWADCARAIGYASRAALTAYFDMMPEHLRP